LADQITWREILNACYGHLASELRRLEDTLPANAKPDERGGLIVASALRFGLDTICCVTREIEADRPCHAAIVTRPFFELAARVRWAGLIPDGWNRLVAYWAYEHRKIGKNALEWDNSDQGREALQGLCDFYESAELDSVKPCPGAMKQVLDDIDQALGVNKEGVHSWRVDYTAYRDMCRASHANLTLCGGGIPTSKLGPVVITNNIYASYVLTEAWGRLIGLQIDEEYGSLRDLQDACGRLEWH